MLPEIDEDSYHAYLTDQADQDIQRKIQMVAAEQAVNQRMTELSRIGAWAEQAQAPSPEPAPPAEQAPPPQEPGPRPVTTPAPAAGPVVSPGATFPSEPSPAPPPGPAPSLPEPAPLRVIGSGGTGVTDLTGNAPAPQAQTGVTTLNLAPTPLPTPPPQAPSPSPIAAPTGALPTPTGAPGSFQEYARQAALKAGVDPDIYLRQIQQESGFNPNAKSPAGATGIAQFMPGTAQGMGIDPTDPYASLDAGARLMRSNLDKYKGDYSLALAAYNAGPGNVDKYGGVPPFEETQRYVRNILGGERPTTPTPDEGLARAGGWAQTNRDISQFDSQLTNAQAYAACGPAAAVRFAQRFGRNPSLKEAVEIARTVGWTEDQGMAGLGSEKALMDKLGVPTRMIGPDWKQIAAEAQTGNPVTISTQGHYFTADGYDPQSGAFHVGRSGLDLKGGSEWMTPDQMTRIMGPAQGALLADNPTVASPSTAEQETNPGGWLDKLKSTFTQAVTGKPEVSGIQVIGGAPDAETQALDDSLQVAHARAREEPTQQAASVGEPQAIEQSPVDKLKDAFGGFIDSLTGNTTSTTTTTAPGGGYDPSALRALTEPPQEGIPLRQDARDTQRQQTLWEQIAPNLGFDEAELARRREALRSGETPLAQPPEWRPKEPSEYEAGDYAGVLGGVFGGQPFGQVASQQQKQSAVEQLQREFKEASPTTTWGPDVTFPGQEEPTHVGGSLVQGMADMIIQNPLLFAPGAPGFSALNRFGGEVVEAVLPNLGPTASRLTASAINGGVQNAIFESGKAGATPETIGEQFLLGAGMGSLLEGSPVLAKRLGLEFIRGADRLLDALGYEPEIAYAATRAGGGDGFSKALEVPSNAGTRTMYDEGLPKTETPNVSDVANRFVRAVTNRREAVDRFVEDALKASGKFDPKRPPEELDLSAQVRQMATDGTVKLAEQRHIKPAIKNLVNAGAANAEVARKVLSDYLTHRNNIDIASATGNTYRTFPGGGSLMESQKALAEMKAEMSAEEWKALEDSGAMVYDLVGSLRKRMLDSGLIDKSDYAMWNGQMPHWVPTKILDYLDAEGGPKVGSKISLGNNGVHSYTDEGTARFREDPLNSLLATVAQVERNARKNEAVRTILDLDALDGNPTITPTDRPVVQGENVIQYIRDGTVERHVAPKELAAVINNPSIEQAPGFVRPWVNFQRNVMTVFNPAFALIRNPTLDVPTYLTRQTARAGGDGRELTRIVPILFDSYADAFKGILKGEYGGEHTQRFVERGGSTSTLVSSAGKRAEEIEKIAGGNGIQINNAADAAGAVRKILGRGVSGLGDVAERMDLGPRVAAMRLAEARGASPRRATLEGRNVTIDFDEGGTLAKTINSFIPFFNVGIQDTAQVARMFQENPKTATAAMVMTVGLPQIAAEAWNRADEQRSKDYDDVPEYIKRQGPIIMHPGEAPVDKDGNRHPQYWQINMGSRAPFATAARQSVNALMGASGQYGTEGRGKPRVEDWQTFLSDMFWQAAPTRATSLADVSRSLVPEFIPGTNTALQLALNKDLYRGTDIATERSDRDASQAAREIGGALTKVARLKDPQHEIRPSQIDFAVKDMLGNWGEMALGSRQFLPGAEERQGNEPQKIPVLGGMLKSAGVRGDIGEEGRRARERTLTPSAQTYLQEQGVEYVPDPVSQDFQGIPLLREEQTRLQQLTNKYVDNEIQQLRQDNELAGLTPAEKLDIVQGRIAAARDQAESEIISAIPDTDWQRRLDKRMQAQEAGVR